MAIKTFLARDNSKKKHDEMEIEVNKEALRTVYWDEIKKCYDFIIKKFEAEDFDKTGTVTLVQFKKVIHNCQQVTPHEANLIFRNIKTEDVEYKDFKEMLYSARFQIARSRIMDTNIEVLDKHLLEQFKAVDKNDDGILHIDHIKNIMLHSKIIHLTPLQIHMLLGLSNPDGDNFVDYREFSLAAKSFIEQYFLLDVQVNKANIKQLTQESKYRKSLIKMDKYEVFQLFKKYDRNQNGFLDQKEY